MRKIKNGFIALVCLLLVPVCQSCGEDGPDNPDNPGTSSGTGTSDKREIEPGVKIITCTSTTDEFTVAFRVRSVEKPDVTLYWSSEKKKTSSPRLNKNSSVRRTYEEVYVPSAKATEYYYKVTHAGFSPGDYVYYKVSASNSCGTDESQVGYVIIKR